MFPLPDTVSISVDAGSSALKIEMMMTASTIRIMPNSYAQVTFSPIKQHESKVTMKASQVMMLVPSP